MGHGVHIMLPDYVGAVCMECREGDWVRVYAYDQIKPTGAPSREEQVEEYRIGFMREKLAAMGAVGDARAVHDMLLIVYKDEPRTDEVRQAIAEDREALLKP